jgi:hypothetical protein
MNNEWPHHWTMEANLEFLKKSASRSGSELKGRNGPVKAADEEFTGIRKNAPAGGSLKHGNFLNRTHPKKSEGFPGGIYRFSS